MCHDGVQIQGVWYRARVFRLDLECGEGAQPQASTPILASTDAYRAVKL